MSANITANKNARFLALGDSYTIGESVSETERWTSQLVERLKAHHVDMDVQVIAKTGWTTGELWQAMGENTITPPYELVSLLVGVNNQYRGYSIDEYREEFRFILKHAIEYAGQRPGRVLVLSIPDWGVTPYALENARLCEVVSGEIDRFNAVNLQETRLAGARYIDVTSVSRQASNDLSLIANDGLHPSGKMYALWADLVLPQALLALAD